MRGRIGFYFFFGKVSEEKLHDIVSDPFHIVDERTNAAEQEMVDKVGDDRGYQARGGRY